MTRPDLSPGEFDALGRAIAEHPFAAGIAKEHVIEMAKAAAQVHIDAGAFVFRRGGAATALYLITEGTVALEVLGPGHEPLAIETIQPGEALGWSWLFPDRAWQFDAHCLHDVTAVAIDAAYLRRLIYDDPVLGRDLVLRIGRVVVDRLVHARAQLIDAHHHDDLAGPTASAAPGTPEDETP